MKQLNLDWLPPTEIIPAPFKQISARLPQLGPGVGRANDGPGPYLAPHLQVQATQMLEQVGEGLLQQGGPVLVQHWLQALPRSVCRQRPQLLYLTGLCAWYSDRPAEARRYFEQALGYFEAEGDLAGQEKCWLQLVASAIAQQDVEQAGQFIRRALLQPISHHSRVRLLMQRVWFSVIQGEWNQAQADFDQATFIAEEKRDRRTLRTLMMQMSPVLGALPGGSAHIETLCRLAAHLSPAPERNWQDRIDWHLALNHWQQGRLDRAYETARQVLRQAQTLGNRCPPIASDMLKIMAVVHTLRGHYVEANDYFMQLLNRLRLAPEAGSLRLEALYLLGRKHWLQGLRAETDQIYRQMLQVKGVADLPLAQVLLPMLRGLLALNQGQEQVAEAEFRQAVQREQAIRLSKLICTPRLLLAHLHLRNHRPNQAMAELAPVLAECNRGYSPASILQEGPIIIPLLQMALRCGLYPATARHLLRVIEVNSEGSLLM